jgi:hypothetical protein
MAIRGMTAIFSLDANVLASIIWWPIIKAAHIMAE